MSDLSEQFRRIASECRDMKESADLWNKAADALDAKDVEIERRDELLTHWDHCLSSFYGNNIIDSVRRAMRCTRDGVEIPKPWEARPDYSNEVVKLKAENERLTEKNERLREVEETARQFMLEVSNAMYSGPSWYTQGESGLRSQIYRWLERMRKALLSASTEQESDGE